MGTLTNKQKIIYISELVPDISYFDFDGFNDDEEDEDYEVACFSTRQNGDMVNDEPGDADFAEARRICYRIKEIYEEVVCKIHYCDEWVFVEFTFNEE